MLDVAVVCGIYLSPNQHLIHPLPYLEKLHIFTFISVKMKQNKVDNSFHLCSAVSLPRDALYPFQTKWVPLSRKICSIFENQVVSDIFLSSACDEVVTYPLAHPLDFLRASIGYSKAVEPLIIIWLIVSKIIFVCIVSFKQMSWAVMCGCLLFFV